MKRCLMLLFCGALLGASVGSAADLAPSNATYALSRGMLGLGDARFRLAPEAATGCWRYEYQAKPSGLARLFIGEISERSDFCIVDGQIRSKRFEFRRADKSSEDFTLDFDWDARVVRSSRGELRELKDGMIDRLAMQIAIQRWVIDRKGEPGQEEFSITKVEDDRTRTYRFRITGRETIQVPAGRIETVRVERSDDTRKSTRFWLAPDRAYAAIRVEQSKDGDEQIKMQLK
ncbi:MAG: DUF3108 domain-containing protein [Panacagrimonas sp.]